MKQPNWMMVVMVLLLIAPGVGSTATCPFSFLYHFGDGVTDIGNSIHVVRPPHVTVPSARPPYGTTFPGEPTGRWSDGLIDFDYTAEDFRLPNIVPYLAMNQTEAKSCDGVIFSVARSPVLHRSFFRKRNIAIPAAFAVPLSRQFGWFMKHLNTINLHAAVRDIGMNTMVEQRRIKQEHNDSCLVDHVVVLDDLPENLVFDILVRLPLEALCRSRFVCKSWFEIISSPDFRNAHLHRSDTTTTRGLIFLTPVKNYINFMEIKDGKSTIKEYKTAFNIGKIRAACNGLIVLERNPKTAGLVLHNPVTREDEDIPLGTILSSSGDDLYGLAFFHASRRYKLLHLFMKDRIKWKLGCEITDVGSGSWRAVDVPPTKYFDLMQNPIFAMGSLHWIHYEDDGRQCMVSIPLDDEKFKSMAVPETGGCFNYFSNSVFATGEFVGFAGRLQRYNEIGVWILRGECGGGWEKQYDIDIESGMGQKMTNFLCFGGVNGRHAFIFKCIDGCLYAYDDRHSQHIRKIEDIDYNVADTTFWRIFPHVNTLVSWRN